MHNGCQSDIHTQIQWMHNEFRFITSSFVWRYLVLSRCFFCRGQWMCLACYLVHTSEVLTFLLNVMAVHRVNGCTRLVGREIYSQTHTLTRNHIFPVHLFWSGPPIVYFPYTSYLQYICSVTSICFPLFFLSLNPISSSVLLLHLSSPPLRTHTHHLPPHLPQLLKHITVWNGAKASSSLQRVRCECVQRHV